MNKYKFRITWLNSFGNTDSQIDECEALTKKEAVRKLKLLWGNDTQFHQMAVKK